jgi:hypothetical protein
VQKEKEKEAGKKEEKRLVKLKVKGKAAVDPESGLDEDHHVRIIAA